MQTYIDREGVCVQAYQVNGPTVLNTVTGELCAALGQWVIVPPDGKIAVISHESFIVSFILVG